MTDARRYAELQDVVMDPSFPELDVALRRGRHIDREDFAWYTLLTEAQHHLEAFYRRYGGELVHKADGYFYLLPTGDMLSRRQLAPSDMLVGQALALLYLDPATIERGGRITAQDVVAQLVVVLGSDGLIRAFNPKLKRRYDERIAQKNVRTQVGSAIRHLASLGFVDLDDDGNLKLRPSLLRFAEPVRGMSAPAEALAKLVALGEVALVSDAEGDGDADADGGDGGDDGDDDDSDGDDRHRGAADDLAFPPKEASDDLGEDDADDLGGDIGEDDGPSNDRGWSAAGDEGSSDDLGEDDADDLSRSVGGDDGPSNDLGWNVVGDDGPSNDLGGGIVGDDGPSNDLGGDIGGDDGPADDATAEGTLPLGDLLAPVERPTATPLAASDEDDDPPYVFDGDDDDEPDGDEADR